MAEQIGIIKVHFYWLQIHPYLTKHRCLFLLNFVHSAEHMRHWVLRLLKPNRLIKADLFEEDCIFGLLLQVFWHFLRFQSLRKHMRTWPSPFFGHSLSLFQSRGGADYAHNIELSSPHFSTNLLPMCSACTAAVKCWKSILKNMAIFKNTCFI